MDEDVEEFKTDRFLRQDVFLSNAARVDVKLLRIICNKRAKRSVATTVGF